ncbi:hypothetical protein C8R45DRAFT_116268 [Mycena sanguinolenta]|nr:hypothetical protein C8R45DRAFT_289131 [Mycena sanguinolenta]KAJ6499460.1 hypothetical protein C8R45DRAFT_116268 [Mycena sanguinolenta]
MVSRHTSRHTTHIYRLESPCHSRAASSRTCKHWVCRAPSAYIYGAAREAVRMLCSSLVPRLGPSARERGYSSRRSSAGARTHTFLFSLIALLALVSHCAREWQRSRPRSWRRSLECICNCENQHLASLSTPTLASVRPRRTRTRRGFCTWYVVWS